MTSNKKLLPGLLFWIVYSTSISITFLFVLHVESFLAKRLILFGIEDDGQGIRHLLRQIAGRRWRRLTNDVGLLPSMVGVTQKRNLSFHSVRACHSRQNSEEHHDLTKKYKSCSHIQNHKRKTQDQQHTK